MHAGSPFSSFFYAKSTLQISSDTSTVFFSVCGPWWETKERELIGAFFFPKLCTCACHKWLNEVTAFWVVIMTSWNVLEFILHVLLSNEHMSHIGKQAINRTGMVINNKLLVKVVDFWKRLYPFFSNHVTSPTQLWSYIWWYAVIAFREPFPTCIEILLPFKTESPYSSFEIVLLW